ncbi:class I SAM-dependent methyltransferase [Aerococcaceae bacterium zg-BR9]|uniref:class I SAM-dependent methyltransferase n=1 Tax=Aerococcaceae bacterium zg-1292 TaxID=2774330 RepID=UPI00406389D6|nr:class I SAM-dependent methyltransferase [Aerococcaceae bacterium zg-BR9]MBF6626294.1 class I SAM-dependent methyltransferase [Aerococcaceae bacterium zg-BR9]
MTLSTESHWNEVWQFHESKEEYNNIYSRSERAKNIIAYFIEKGVFFGSNTKVLEAGCGDGAILFELLQLFKIEGHGIDFSAVALDTARKNMALNNKYFNLELSDVRNLPYENDYFDRILSLGVIEHFESPTESLKEMYRTLAPGGILILMTPNKYSFGKIDRIVKMIFKKWKFGYQTEYSDSNLEHLSKKIGFHCFYKETVLRKPLASDSRSFKLISRVDQILNVFNKNIGFYSYVFLTK